MGKLLCSIIPRTTMKGLKDYKYSAADNKLADLLTNYVEVDKFEELTEKIKVLEVKTNHLFKHPEEILQFQLESFRESLSKTVELLIEEHMSTFLSKMSQKITKCEADFQFLKNSLKHLATRQKKVENELRFTNTSEILEKDCLSAL